MLVTCAEGHNTSGEVLCQSIFTLEDLIKLVWPSRIGIIIYLYFHCIYIYSSIYSCIILVTHPVTHWSFIHSVMSVFTYSSIQHIHIHFHLHSYILSHVNIPSILGNPDVSIERKKPFARLLNWAYLNTEKESVSSIDTLVKNE